MIAHRLAEPTEADDVVQDTWITVIRGIGRFEGRSTLKTWIYGILVNIARRRAQKYFAPSPRAIFSPLA